ncbi:MAG: thioredoxin [Acidimicrobiia bacterium]|nr:thioredoxin [Acidimicrobiia bacterium]
MRSVSEADFAKDVIQAEGRVVVDFWAPWCTPCKAVAPELEKLAEKHTGVEFVKVNVDEAPGVAADYQIMGIPTIGVFEAGELKATSVGAKPAEKIEQDLGL